MHVVAAIIVGISLLLSMQPAVAASMLDGIGQDVLVQFKNNVNKTKQSKIQKAACVAQMKAFQMIGNVQHWQLATPMDAEKLITQLSQHPDIAYIEPNYRRYFRAIPDDPGFIYQWGLNNIGQFAGAVQGMDMQLPSAWDITTGSKSVVVAVIDDSVDIWHEDLYANIWTNPGEIPNNGIDDDNNGYTDDVHGWDFLGNDNDPSADAGSGEGHGTYVSGLIGAVGNNALGVTGVNWDVSIMPLKFNGTVASELEAINYAIANGAKIVNASWGGPQFSYAESAGMQNMLNNGVLLVAAAGNYEANNDKVLDYPSGLPYANVLAVSSHNMVGEFSPWAHFGSITVDVAAPGRDIYSTSTVVNAPLLYEFVSGTSFSAPLTAGVAALVLAQYPTLSYQEIKGRIMASATPMTQRGLSATDGRVNASGALTIQPQSELVISELLMSDANNQLIDPNEQVSLDISLENVWLAATGITATLSTTDTLVTITQPTGAWADLSMGAKGKTTTAFTFDTGDFSGYRLIPFTLDITTAEGVTFQRYFLLSSGSLQADVIYQESIMQNDQDEFQYFYFEVPVGAASLNISTTSTADIDLLVRFGSEPKFDYSLYPINPVFGYESGTKVSTNNQTGDEQILVLNPQAGIWHAVVVSFDQKAANYAIQASVTSSKALSPSTVVAQGTSTTQTPTGATSGGAGGLCLNYVWVQSPAILVWLLVLALYVRRRKCRIYF